MEGITTTRVAAWGAAVALVTGGVIGATTAAASPARQDEASTSRMSAQKTTQKTAQESQVRAGGASTAVSYPRMTARWAGAVNVYSRTAVNTAYWRNYGGGLTVPTGYAADDTRCQRGGG